MMTNQREALDAAVREGMTYGTPGERAIIGLLAALLAEVTPPEAEPEPQVDTTEYESVTPEVGAVGVLDGKQVGVWLHRREVDSRVQSKAVAVSVDGTLLLIPFDDLSSTQRIGRPAKPKFQAPLHEEVARDPSKWRDHPEPKAQERLRVVEGFGTDYDLLPSDIKSKYGSRFVYIVSRAKSVDEGMGMVM